MQPSMHDIILILLNFKKLEFIQAQLFMCLLGHHQKILSHTKFNFSLIQLLKYNLYLYLQTCNKYSSFTFNGKRA